MPMEPLSDRVLVKPIKPEDKTEGGIIIPESAKDQPTKGVVVLTGPGKLLKTGEIIPVAVKPGDTILFNKYGCTELKLNGEPHLIMLEEQIMAVLED